MGCCYAAPEEIRKVAVACREVGGVQEADSERR